MVCGPKKIKDSVDASFAQDIEFRPPSLLPNIKADPCSRRGSTKSRFVLPSVDGDYHWYFSDKKRHYSSISAVIHDNIDFFLNELGSRMYCDKELLSCEGKDDCDLDKSLENDVFPYKKYSYCSAKNRFSLWWNYNVEIPNDKVKCDALIKQEGSKRKFRKALFGFYPLGIDCSESNPGPGGYYSGMLDPKKINRDKVESSYLYSMFFEVKYYLKEVLRTIYKDLQNMSTEIKDNDIHNYDATTKKFSEKFEILWSIFEKSAVKCRKGNFPSINYFVNEHEGEDYSSTISLDIP